MNLNTTSTDEHVPDIERQIFLMKERARDVRSTLPFKVIPFRITIELVYYVHFWLKAFPPQSGVYMTYIP
jgi:hypothetical protein